MKRGCGDADGFGPVANTVASGRADYTTIFFDYYLAVWARVTRKGDIGRTHSHRD